jgi:hypothetical protein
LHHGSIRASNAKPGLCVDIDLPTAIEPPVKPREALARKT